MMDRDRSGEPRDDAATQIDLADRARLGAPDGQASAQPQPLGDRPKPLVRKRYSQALRLLQIYRSLANARDGLTLTELMARTGVTRRTLNRDLALLSEDHLVRCLDRDADGHKRWALLPAGPASSISFSQGELLSLYLSRSMLDFTRGTGLYESVRGAFDKVADRLAGTELAALSLQRKLYAVPDAPPVRSSEESYDDVLNDVLTAVLKGNRLQLQYPVSGSPEAILIEVDPLTLAYYRGRLYLIANSPHHDCIHPFALHRVHRAKRLRNTHATIPDGYDPARYFSGQFGIFRGEQPAEVRVRFYGSAARYARERSWHSSQQVTDLAGGDCELSWRVPITPDLRSWLLSFGASAEVVSPPSLRAAMAAELRRALARLESSC